MIPVKTSPKASKIFDTPAQPADRLLIWLENQIRDYCRKHQLSLNETSERSGNSRSYLSSLFKKRSDIGIRRFHRICESLNIQVTEAANSAIRGGMPSIDEISDLVSRGQIADHISAFLPFVVIYSAPKATESKLELLHMGHLSFAAEVMGTHSKETLERAVNSFPESARKKLLASYMLAASGTCVITTERMSAHLHGQPDKNELLYKRFLFPAGTYEGRQAVAIFAESISTSARWITSSIEE